MKYLLLLIVILYSSFVCAQSITISEPLNLRSDVSYEVVGDLEGQVLLFRDQATSFKVTAFDQNMRQKWEKELELDKRQPKVIGLFADKSEFVLFYYFRYKSKTLIKAHKYNAGANLIDSVTLKDMGYLFYTPNFELLRSEDRTKVLLFHLERSEQINALSFDVQNMKLLWEKAIIPQDFSYYQDFRQILIDNNGDMHLVLERDNLRHKRDKHRFEIITYFGKNDELLRYEVPMIDRLTYDVVFDFDNRNQNLIGAGLYSEKNLGRADGYFYLSIPDRKPESFRFAAHVFDENFISTLLGKEEDKVNGGIPDVSVQEIVLRRDGGALIIAERNRLLERQIGGGSRSVYDGRFAIDYYYDELFILSVHPSGEPHWQTILHKKQYSQDDDGAYSSYFLFKTVANLHFIFNDEIKYENTVSEYVLQGTGAFERNSLLSTANLQLRLRFRDALQINSAEVIIPSERRNRLRLVRMKYE
ncbi:MAG TPA: hypothetical protein PKA00_02425 [Saprospiraceae bacterium]|nr:hypothetical protein [Saprospiraceae bacterium]HMQ81728.1 hypothetical protein [Saprospiraceae bacterium]